MLPSRPASHAIPQSAAFHTLEHNRHRHLHAETPSCNGHSRSLLRLQDRGAVAFALVQLQTQNATVSEQQGRVLRRLKQQDDAPSCLVACTGTPDDVNFCGSDGKVYYNQCFFKNAQCRDTSLTSAAWVGPNCPNSWTQPKPCKEVTKFLCGSDGNVYFGYCNLYDAQCVDPALQEIACPAGIIQFPLRQTRA